jgi:hypothetical protein
VVESETCEKFHSKLWTPTRPCQNLTRRSDKLQSTKHQCEGQNKITELGKEQPTTD